MGRVTRLSFQELHIFRVKHGQLESAAERWWGEIGGRLRGEDPRVIDAWLDEAGSSFILVLADRHHAPLAALLERGKSVLRQEVEEVFVHELTGFHERHLFVGEPQRPDPTLPDPKPLAWTRIDIGEDDRTLRIAYVRGVVNYLHHVETTADQWNVEVTVFLGFDREYWQRVQLGERMGFTPVGIGEWTEIVLPEAVGERFVLDGARTD